MDNPRTVSLNAISENSTPLGDVFNIDFTTTNSTVNIKWCDPYDIIKNKKVISQWAGTKLIKKEGSIPSNINDGEIIADSIIRNQYSTTGIIDTNLTAGVDYYYRFFPYTTQKNITNGTVKNIHINITTTVNLYSAVSDTITFTDLTGNHTVTTDNTGKAQNINIVISANNTPITFTSNIAKNPNNLSNKYSKNILITSNTNTIKVMPDNVVYWYGYKNDYTWSRNSSNVTFSYNTNYLYGYINNGEVKGGYTTDQTFNFSQYSRLNVIYSGSITPTYGKGAYIELLATRGKNDDSPYTRNTILGVNSAQVGGSTRNTSTTLGCIELNSSMGNGYIYIQIRGEPTSSIVNAVFFDS